MESVEGGLRTLSGGSWVARRAIGGLKRDNGNKPIHGGTDPEVRMTGSEANYDCDVAVLGGGASS